MITCVANGCTRRFGLFCFTGGEWLCPWHISHGQARLLDDLAERGQKIGVKGGHWPYGPNVYVDQRLALVEWAESTGYRLAYPRSRCLHWVVGQARRCAALHYLDSRHEHVGVNALDHATFWTRGGPALILGQPYDYPDDAWIERITAEWPVSIEVTERGPWYSSRTHGVFVTPKETGCL